MTYFGFLARFVLLPILIFAVWHWWDEKRGKRLPSPLRAFPSLKMLVILVVIALVYTTPWDNYLVATGVWWYDPSLVTGIVLGWVPLEEYTFFILQPVLVGLWLLWVARRLPVSPSSAPTASWARPISLLMTGTIWMVSLIILIAGWQPGTYLALELVWALPPVMLQLWFGAETLVRHWRVVLFTIVPMALYLSAADSLAIASGTWTIDPTQSLGLLIGGGLPVEEFLFFTLTTTLVTFGLVLGIAEESWKQLRSLRLVNSLER